MDEVVYFFIKPECYSRRDDILADIKRHFTLEMKGEIELEEEWISLLYPGIDDVLFQLTKKYLGGRIVFGRISGFEALARFVRYAGLDVAPSRCEKYTLRFKYGNHIPQIENGVVYYQNGIHRPKDFEENEIMASVVSLWQRKNSLL